MCSHQSAPRPSSSVASAPQRSSCWRGRCPSRAIIESIPGTSAGPPRAVLEPVIARYRGTAKRLYFHGDAAFANLEIYELLEAEGMGYAIRLPANRVLQDKIGYRLKRPVGATARRCAVTIPASATGPGSWNKPRRVVAKVRSHSASFIRGVGFIVTNLASAAGRARRRLLHHRGTCEALARIPMSSTTTRG